MNALVDAISNPTLWPVLVGTAALGAISGAVGTFAVVRRRSLQGDAVSHAALPGVALAYLAGGRGDVTLLLGAAATGWLALALVSAVARQRPVPFDAALAGALAVFFGLGLVLMGHLQNSAPGQGGVRLQQYLFGQEAATLRFADLLPILTLGLPAVLVLAAGFKEFALTSFDPEFGATLGYPPRRLDALLTALLVLAVVIGLQTVGVVLVSALLVAPAVAARQWSHRLGRVTLLAGGFGALAGVAGTLASHVLSAPGRAVPTGPTIVLAATALALGSLAAQLRRS